MFYCYAYRSIQSRPVMLVSNHFHLSCFWDLSCFRQDLTIVKIPLFSFSFFMSCSARIGHSNQHWSCGFNFISWSYVLGSLTFSPIHRISKGSSSLAFTIGDSNQHSWCEFHFTSSVYIFRFLIFPSKFRYPECFSSFAFTTRVALLHTWVIVSLIGPVSSVSFLVFIS